jgi:hypothetical protein
MIEMVFEWELSSNEERASLKQYEGFKTIKGGSPQQLPNAKEILEWSRGVKVS